jgi:phosphoglycerate dehydrogenase-like enzyme
MSSHSSRAQILVAIVPELRKRLFAPDVELGLRELGQVRFHERATNLTSAELAAQLGEFDAVITGWGSPAFDDSVMAARGKLRVVAHSAGSIKHLFPPALFESGIQVTHSAAAIAPAVAEMSLTLTLALLRRAPQYIDAMRKGAKWEDALSIGFGPELSATRVGVVGVGYTGRCFVRLLRALDAEVCVFDPYLTPEHARDLGVQKVDLDELLKTSAVVSLQAPSTPETHHMIGRRQLAMMRDGTIFINTARSWLVDGPALLDELKRGRLIAALDVFDEEPLPVDSPLRSLPNVYLMSHVAGGSMQTALRQGRLIVEELSRFFSGKPLQFPVTLQMLQTMA